MADGSQDRRRDARRAAREAVDLHDGATTAATASRPPVERDPVAGALRRAGILRLLVLDLLGGEQPAYGNRLIERIRELSGGLLVVNPNTMYPLLRTLQEEGFAEGEWEHPERRSRRFYRLTEAGAVERERLRAEVLPALDGLVDAVSTLRAALDRRT